MNLIEFAVLFSLILTIIVSLSDYLLIQSLKKKEPNLASEWLVVLGILMLSYRWIIPLIITLVGWVFELGFLYELHFIWLVLYSVGLSFTVNGFLNTKIIQKIFLLFRKK